MIIIAINCFVIIVNFRNRFVNELTEIFQFCMALQAAVLASFDIEWNLARIMRLADYQRQVGWIENSVIEYSFAQLHVTC
jgi:hypothetical protein